MMRYVRFIEVGLAVTFCDCVVDLPELPEGNKLDKNHLPEYHVLPSGFMNTAKVMSDKQFVLDSDHERGQIILAMESKCEMSEPNHKTVDWFRKIGCVHSIKMCK